MNLKRFSSALIFTVLASLNQFSVAAVTLNHSEEIRHALGLDRFKPNNHLKKLKIAVIDNGFQGYEPSKSILPESTKLIDTYPAEFIKKFNLGDPSFQQPPSPTEHGRIMAQIVWFMTGGHSDGPQFYLLNANGMTNFRRAVRFAIEEKVDIILYAQNRECCGNFDGEGFLNAIVNEATKQNIIWINAAGNYGGYVLNKNYASRSVQEPIKIKSTLDESKAQIILNWTANVDEENSGTDKDLDLYLYDESGTEVAKSTYTQVVKKDKLEEGESYLARERILYSFSKNTTGHYTVKIKAKSNNFSRLDRIRLVLIPERPDGIQLIGASPSEEIMVPADNPNVITVGEVSPSSAKGPTADGRIKPEIHLENSEASFSNGFSSSGTSNAAAYFAGIVAVLKSQRPSLNRAQIISFPKKTPLSAQIQKIAFSEIQFKHDSILNTVEDSSHESAILAGRYSDGRYVIGTRTSPVKFLSQLCQTREREKESENESDSLEIYLRATGTRTEMVQCYTRKISPNLNTEQNPYPWDRNTNTRQMWVEVRQVRQSYPGPSTGIWVTPLPEQLLNH